MIPPLARWLGSLCKYGPLLFDGTTGAFSVVLYGTLPVSDCDCSESMSECAIEWYAEWYVEWL